MIATVAVARLWLERFRAIEALDLTLGRGLTVFTGANAQGKTSLLEAVAWVARGRSFRGVPDAALVQRGWDQAIVRAEIDHDDRRQLFEAELRAVGRNRVQLNRTTVNRRQDLHDLVRVTVFSPDDLDLVKAGPAHRREYLDDLLATLARRYAAARTDYERILKHRNALLRGGVRDATDRATLEVFDEQLISAATELVRGRLKLLDSLRPAVAAAYRDLVHDHDEVDIDIGYECEWSETPLTDVDPVAISEALRAALRRLAGREADRRLTLVGPHRDELHLTIDGLDARTHASQGEQRSLALALRLAGHRTVGALTGALPVLLLDDVFSELDRDRVDALVASLPPGQTLLTTAGALPESVHPERVLRVTNGKLCE